MVKDSFIKCPWCNSTGRQDYDGLTTMDYSTAPVAKENHCCKCEGSGWLHIDRLALLPCSDIPKDIT